MASKKYILGVDVGTTGLKCIVWDASAKMRGQAYERLKTNYGDNGHATQNPDVVFEVLVRVIKQSMRNANVATNEVASMGLSAQRASFTIWDRDTGKTAIPLILWKDSRTHSELPRLNHKFGLTGYLRFFASVLYKVTGSPQMLTVSQFRLKTHHLVVKVKNILEKNKDLRTGVESGKLLYGTLDTYLLWRLTRGASSTAWWDPYEMKWGKAIGWLVSPSRGEYFPPEKILPPTKDSSDDYGECDKSIFGEPIPINDQQASFFGQLCWEKGVTKVTLGTGGFININTGSTCLAATGADPIVGWKIGSEVVFGLEANQRDVGPIIDWIVQNKWANSYSHLNEISRSFNQPTTLCFVPAITGGGLGAPFCAPTAPAMFVGLTEYTTTNEMIQAMLQSIGLRIQQLLEFMSNDTKFHVSEIYVDGGASEDSYLVQFIADITKTRVIRPLSREVREGVTSRGTAFLAGLYIKFWDREQLKRLVTTDYEVFEPREIPDELRERVIRNFRLSCEVAQIYGEALDEQGSARSRARLSMLLFGIFCLWVFYNYFFCAFDIASLYVSK